MVPDPTFPHLSGLCSGFRQYRRPAHGRSAANAFLYVRKCVMELLFRLPHRHIDNVYVECTLIRKSLLSQVGNTHLDHYFQPDHLCDPIFILPGFFHLFYTARIRCALYHMGADPAAADHPDGGTGARIRHHHLFFDDQIS